MGSAGGGKKPHGSRARKSATGVEWGTARVARPSNGSWIWRGPRVKGANWIGHDPPKRQESPEILRRREKADRKDCVERLSGRVGSGAGTAAEDAEGEMRQCHVHSNGDF